MQQPLISYYPISHKELGYNYVVIAAKHQNRWLWVRHRDRDTWEMPGGHVEPNETVNNAASRELFEETGAIAYTLAPIADFAVEFKGKLSWNRLFLAHIETLGPLPESEIKEVKLFDHLPSTLTYSLIQPQLLSYIKEQTPSNNQTL
ncbi:MAG: NUDIX domain-containing protein [Bacteroidales bacterium]|nr:NUDIX domain-containing protein [Bacteroidales bacterium]MBN2748354.1 NUDIX domain-containing protein [Bacteroidales bacterium]